MKIGIDIDNVISNFNDELLKEYLKHDKELRNTGIINKDVFIRYGMFDWTEKEETEFYKNNIERIAIKLKPIHRATETIKKLKEDGNEIIIISGRNNGEYNNPYKLTEEWLEKYNVIYDKLILTNAYNKKEKYIKIHIPKGDKLDHNEVINSIKDSKKEIEKYFKIKNYEYYCESWLLNKEIKKLLDNNSNILKFQKLFDITEGKNAIKDILNFVFDLQQIDSYYNLPENTSLQSRIKGLLIDGKEIYIGIGKLKDERTKNRL